MSWFTRDVTEAKKRAASGGGGRSSNGDRVWMPVGAEKEFVFLDDPVMYWEHVEGMGKNKEYSVCLRRNKISSNCEGCKVDNPYAYYVGLHSVIGLTRWESRSGRVYQFQRQIFAAKWGSSKKPATLQRLQGKAQRFGGTMVGLRIVSKRLGDMSDSCGDDIDVIERVGSNLEEIRAWLMPQIESYIKNDCSDDYDLEKHLRYNPIECYDFEAMMDPNYGDSNSGGGEKPKSDDDFYSGNNFSDDDIPF